jgi:esterase/lipase superfamily enzyme
MLMHMCAGGRRWLALVALALLTGCAGLPLSEGLEPASLQSAQGANAPEIVHLPRYAITGAQPVKASTMLGLAATSQQIAKTAEQQQFDVVTLFWATNRTAQPRAAVKPAPATGESLPLVQRTAFNATRAKSLTLGLAQVTVPKYDRPVGTIARPRQVAVLSVGIHNEKEDPRRHFTIGNLRDLTRDQFFTLANAEGAKARDFKDHAFVFVHGYNTTFEDAIYRTAQLAHDMAFDGVPYVFAWPSKGETLSYPYDRESADASTAQFSDFLDLVAKRTNAKKIHIIAHSMGARLVLDTFFPAKATAQAARLSKVDQIVLAAADIDRTVLEQRTESIRATGKPVTLYASRNDHALSASRKFSGGVPRAGDVSETGPVILPGIETIDISDTSTAVFNGFNHATFAERAHVLTDMALLMRSGVHPPDKRFPVFVQAGASGAQPHWRYVKN